MGNIFSITADNSVFSILVEYILSTYNKTEIPKLKIILPCKYDVTVLSNMLIFKQCTVLPHITSLENLTEEDSKVANLNKIQVITTSKQILLLTELLLEWNQKNNDNYPIDLVYSILPLLNTENPIKHLKKIGNFAEWLIKSWTSALGRLKMIDKLEYINYSINATILSLHDIQQHILLVGIAKETVYQPLIKAVYNLPHGTLIIPNLNIKISEKNWKSLDTKHYQYIIKKLLDDLKVNKNEINCLSIQPNNSIDYIFDITSKLKIQKDILNNIEVITCSSLEEEAELISTIIKDEGYNNVSLFVDNQLLTIRISCLLKQYDAKIYLYVTLLLYSLDLINSHWNKIPLLSLLKHPLVEFGYTKEKYFKILTEFEIEILRNFNTKSFEEILETIESHHNIKYKKDILKILKSLRVILNPLFEVMNYSISYIVITHLKCFSCISCTGIIADFVNACKTIKTQCSLELYGKILHLFFQKNFFSLIENKLGLYKTKVIIFTNLNYLEEEQSYYLHNLFYANKVYIIRLATQQKSILLKRIEIFCKKSTYSYKSTITNIRPCTQPTPKPKLQVRQEKMKVMSASAVEKLLYNPYTFYIQHILNIKKLKDLNSKLKPSEFSMIIHKIFTKHSHHTSLDLTNLSRMWYIRLEKIIQSFSKINRTSNQKVIEIGKKISFPISKEILLTVKCDRVEYLVDNSIAIIDYKLGSNTPTLNIPLILQALAIEYTTQKKVSQLTYWKFDYGQVKVTSILNCTEKIQGFQSSLPKLLSNYLHEDTAFTGSPCLGNFTEFNDYIHLERTKEWL